MQPGHAMTSPAVAAESSRESPMSRAIKPHAPSCDRNQGPILEVLRQHFAQRRCVLEIGSGTGQHAVFFAAALPGTLWQTSDTEENLAGIRLWLEEAALPNLPAPLLLDVNGPWPDARYDGVFTSNTLHIMSWPEVQQLFALLEQVLEPQASLAVYGPFNYGGQFTSQSNRAFDTWLKQRSSASGIRDFEAVNALARAIGLQLVADHAMPANNRTLVWERG
jgi:cyclopropane fatty-acyl-phospholipid synthase-like methyltransferase